jgi:uncharacterized protein (TIGR00661 family)
MKILYAIQGTGNGHLARARDVYPELVKYGDTDILISGNQVDIDFPFPVKYRFHGLSFIFGKHGGIDKWATFKGLRLGRLLKDVLSLRIHDYDLVISDFEPVSAWACRLHHKPCIALSHQSSVLHKKAPKPAAGDAFGRMVLRHYAPFTQSYGFHFSAFASNVFTPVIRREVRDLEVTQGDHYTVYLPAYDDETIVRELSVFDKVKWQVFSKHNTEPFSFKNIEVVPISNDAFMDSVASCTGVLCGAGFETPAETLYLGKKLMVIPMRGQYEQQCNAAFLETMQVPVIPALHKKHRAAIGDWLANGQALEVHYPDNIRNVVAKVLEDFLLQQLHRSTIVMG